jgi:cytochrome c551/c552
MKKRLSIFIVFILSATISFSSTPVEEGKNVFTSKCASCHNVNKDLTGPALAGFHERRSMDWIINFIKSSQTMIKAGDKDAIAVYEKFNKIPMPDHTDLSDDLIKSIVEYVKVEGASSNIESAPFARPNKIRPAYLPLTAADYQFFIAYLAVVGMLIMALVFAVHIKSLQRQIVIKD